MDYLLVNLDFFTKKNIAMDDILKNIELIKLKKYLEKKYGTVIPYFHFAITEIKFNSNERNPELSIKVNYHNDKESSIIFLFKNFLFHTPIGESYLFDSKENFFEGFSIISIAKKSSIKDFMFKNFQFGFILGLNEKENNDYFIFRVLGQNYFVDVLTNKLPEITYGSLI